MQKYTMGGWQFALLSFAVSVSLVNCAVILDDDVDHQGLYSKSDRVTILTKANYDRKMYGKKYAHVVQFYNSYCGHCRAFYPKYRLVAFETVAWNKILKLGAIDCFNEQNNDICVEVNVSGYPTLRYFHENSERGYHGEDLGIAQTPERLISIIIHKLQEEQRQGRFQMGPALSIALYSTYTEALHDVPNEILFTFLVFEDTNSTIGSQLALDTSGYDHIRVKRVNANCELTTLSGIKSFPGLVVVGPGLAPIVITPNNPTQHDMLQAVQQFLKTHNYIIPLEIINEDVVVTEDPKVEPPVNALNVYYNDLEITVRSILHTEINHKKLQGENHRTLINLLEVIKDNFPYKGNMRLKNYLEELITRINSMSTWTSTDLDNLIRTLEKKYIPYRAPPSAGYIGCSGSKPKYRGYTCGLWTLFHLMTVSAASKPTPESPKVLHAMHGFVKHFFGCTECVQHFLAMADRNRLFDVKDNDRAVLWLWVSHNEVNLRLAGDITDDPVYPKIQFPSLHQCPQCRLINGAWKLPEVYQYLLTFYSKERVQVDQADRSSAQLGQLSNLDLGMLSFLYILSFIIIILVIKFFLTKRFYRKHIYKHGWGKV